jgi:hypothetical protein
LVKEALFDEEGKITNRLVSNQNEFEFFSYEQNSGKGFVAILRKELFTTVKESLNELSVDMLMIEAGPLEVGLLIPILGLNGWQIAGQYKVRFEDDEIREIKALNKEENGNYKIGDDIISSVHLPVFALAINILSGEAVAENADNKHFIDEFSYKKMIEFLGIGALVILFFGLVINYFLFDYYHKKYNQISGEYSLNETLIRKLDQKQDELAGAEELMLKVGLEGQTRFAWFADRLVQLMPSGIILTRLSIQPPDGKLQQGYEMEVKENTIIIEGQTTETLNVHRWVQHIKREEWVEDVEFTSFSQGESKEQAIFSLELIY